ncbi:MAG: ATP-binding protein [Hyphomicrobiales bacterium]|nr:ATP-binding protein [Hyphomicrobiales bacterium]
MPNSLAFRLFVSFAVWSLLVLPVTALVLVSGYRGQIEDGFNEDLNVYLTYLIGSTYPDKGVELKAPNLGEARFLLPLSGYYWQIKTLGTSQPTIIQSESLVSETLKLPSELGVSPDLQLIRVAEIDGPDEQKLRVMEREVSYSDGDQQQSFSYAVALDKSGAEEAIYDFTATLILNLMILAAGLMLATFFQVRYGLWPLRDIGTRLSAIRSGEAERLEGVLPQEILPLQNELNALIQSNVHIVDRARTHVGNLAHALKTPLSVIINEAQTTDSPFAEKVAEQADVMRQQIDHHLNRARIAARSGVIGSVAPVKPIVTALGSALERIYRDRNLTVTIEGPADLKFKGEKQDLEDIVGNLMDNAFKWAQSSVTLTVAQSPASGSEVRMFTVVVSDDGPGLTEEQRASVIKRGRRYDETRPGSGLGLSIVADLAHLYQGKFVLEKADAGGLKAIISLPSA